MSKELTNSEFALYATLFALINTFGGLSTGVFTIICRKVAELSLNGTVIAAGSVVKNQF